MATSEEKWQQASDAVDSDPTIVDDPVRMRQLMGVLGITPDELLSMEVDPAAITQWYDPSVLSKYPEFNMGLPNTFGPGNITPSDNVNTNPPVPFNPSDVSSGGYTLKEAIDAGATPEELTSLGFQDNDIFRATHQAGAPNPVGYLNGTPITLNDALAAGASADDLRDLGFSEEIATANTTAAPGWFNRITGIATDAFKSVGSALGINSLADFKKLTSPIVQGAGTLIHKNALLDGVNNARTTTNNAYNQNIETLKPFVTSQTNDLNAARGTISNIPKLTQAGMPSLNSSLGQKAITPEEWKQANITQGFSYDPNNYYNSPVYKALLANGVQATDASAAARGSFGSGNQAADLQKLGMATGAAYMGQDFGMEQAKYNALNQAQNQQYNFDTARTVGLNDSYNTTTAANVKYANDIAQKNYTNQQDANAAAYNALMTGNNTEYSRLTQLAGTLPSAVTAGVNLTGANSTTNANFDIAKGNVNAGAVGALTNITNNALMGQ